MDLQAVSPLPFDVLAHIMAHSDDQTISMLMKSTRELYYAGAKYILDYDYIVLADLRDVVSWMKFMSAEGGSRFKYLDGLEFRMKALPPRFARWLRRFITENRSLWRINSLRLPHAESFLMAYINLADAFALISTIETLILGEMGVISARMISSLRSQVKHAELDMLPMEDEGSDISDSELDEEEDARNPILLLHNSAYTLETLTAYGSIALPRGLRSLYDEVYPHVHNLELMEASDMQLTALFAHAYPNLRRLRLEMSNNSFKAIELGKTPSLDEQRLLNLREQIIHAGWKGLETVHGSIADLYILALQCPVKNVILSGPIMHQLTFRSVVDDTTPRFLCLRGFGEDIFTRAFANTMSRPSASQLECFEAMITLMEPEDVDVPAMLARLQVFPAAYSLTT